jgi:hypothetical protein
MASRSSPPRKHQRRPRQRVRHRPPPRHRHLHDLRRRPRRNHLRHRRHLRSRRHIQHRHLLPRLQRHPLPRSLQQDPLCSRSGKGKWSASARSWPRRNGRPRGQRQLHLHPRSRTPARLRPPQHRRPRHRPRQPPLGQHQLRLRPLRALRRPLLRLARLRQPLPQHLEDKRRCRPEGPQRRADYHRQRSPRQFRRRRPRRQ